jgi:tetratricopeptide (TPR) repeat protein
MEASATAEISPNQVSSEEMFRRGLAHLRRRARKEAASCFQQAIDLDREGPAKPPKMRYLSYLGLALSMINARSEEAVKLCQRAVKREFYDADLLCNMGIVYLRNRQRGPAFDAFERGLKLKSNHSRILAALERHDKRGQPMFTSLPRDHSVNRLAGRLRCRLLDLLGRDLDNEI